MSPRGDAPVQKAVVDARTVWWDRSEFDAVHVPDERGPVLLVCRRCGALVVRLTDAANRHALLHARSERDHRAVAGVPGDVADLRRLVVVLAVSSALLAAAVAWM